MLSIFSIFIVELVAFRWGTAKLAKIGRTHGKIPSQCQRNIIEGLSAHLDAHGHELGSHAAHGPEGVSGSKEAEASKLENDKSSDVESVPQTHNHIFDHNILTQVIGVGILEFGVVLHRWV